MRPRTVAAVGAAVLVFAAAVVGFAAGRVDLKQSAGEFGILYYPHGARPAAGSTFVCAIWFPPVKIRSAVALPADRVVTLSISSYGAMIKSLNPQRGCGWDVWRGLLFRALLTTAGLAGGAAVLSRSTRFRRGH